MENILEEYAEIEVILYANCVLLDLSDINISLTPVISSLIYAHLCCKVAIL